MITVGVTILVWFPLALEGGPLWKPHYDLAPGPGLLDFCTRSEVDKMEDDPGPGGFGASVKSTLLSHGPENLRLA